MPGGILIKFESWYPEISDSKKCFWLISNSKTIHLTKTTEQQNRVISLWRILLIKQSLDTETVWKQALETTHQATEPEVKGSKGLRSAEKMPEDMLKAVLRHQNGTINAHAYGDQNGGDRKHHNH